MIPQIGIDVGKHALDVCRAGPNDARRWPVQRVHFKNDAWHTTLAQLVPDGSLIVAEPTGWAYLQPIVQALRFINCTLWLVPNSTTANIRRVHISTGKSDKMDARALATAAVWLSEGRPVLGAYIYSARQEEATLRLRALVNEYYAIKKETTRARNRLDQLAHAIWPALAKYSATWSRAVRAGFTTPAQLHELHTLLGNQPVPGYEHGNARRALDRLIARVPPYVTPSDETVRRVHRIFDDLDQYEDRLIIVEKEIVAAIDGPAFQPLTNHWLTVPEASPIAIATLHVATRGIAHTFHRDQFKTAIGAAPRRARSGSTDRTAKQRPGYRPAMVTTHFWTMRLVREDAAPNQVRDYYQQLTAKNHKFAFRAAVAKLARVLSGIARTSTDFKHG